MKSFSERMGLKPIREVLQKDSMDDELRNRLWSLLNQCYWDQFSGLEKIHYLDEEKEFFVQLWDVYFKKPLDTLSDYFDETHDDIREAFFKCKWNNVYDFIEFVANNYPDEELNEKFVELCNCRLQEELSAYRFVGKMIILITSDEEISAIEEALQIPLKPVQEHLKRSLELLADRENPDYRNSIKESISAVESMCKIMTGDSNIRNALNRIRKDCGLHDNLKTAFQNLYSYTSDSNGIRHCMTADPDVGQEEAKFMLVTCSAFVNYLVAKASTKGIDLSTPSPK